MGRADESRRDVVNTHSTSLAPLQQHVRQTLDRRFNVRLVGQYKLMLLLLLLLVMVVVVAAE